MEISEYVSQDMTIYTNDMAEIVESRSLSLDEGMNLVNYTLPQNADKSSLVVDSADGSVEMKGRYDVSDETGVFTKQALVDAYIGETVLVRDEEAKLLSYNANEALVQVEEGYIASVEANSVVFPEMPQSLADMPLKREHSYDQSMMLKLSSEDAGDKDMSMTYVANGISWKEDFNIVRTGDTIDIKGWATVINSSGSTYENINLKLVDGNLNMARSNGHMRTARSAAPMGAAASLESAGGAADYVESDGTVGEHQLYALSNAVDIRPGENTFEHIVAKGIEVTDAYELNVGYGGGSMPVQKFVSFENSKEAGLGMPLPKGEIFYYEKDDHGASHLITNVAVGHKPKNTTVKVHTGQAQDLVTNVFMEDVTPEEILNNPKDRTRLVDYTVTLENHKDEDVTIAVKHQRYNQLELLDASLSNGDKVEMGEVSNNYVFDVDVAAGETVELHYRQKTK